MSRAAPPAVVAFGGNALVRRDDHATQRLQMERADGLAEVLVGLLDEPRALVLVHGNGPQVGDELVRVEEAVTKVPPLSLDLCVAATAGTIGVLLERALRNAASRAGREIEVSTLVSLVRVDEDDENFDDPTKPIGARFTSYRAAQLQRTLGWRMVQESPGSWRRVVASPRPVEIVNLATLMDTLRPGRVLIAAGGGGVPVCRGADGALTGVEAVIDKDHVAAILARELDADPFVILTDVDHVSVDFGTPAEEVARASHDRGGPRPWCRRPVSARLHGAEDRGSRELRGRRRPAGPDHLGGKAACGSGGRSGHTYSLLSPCSREPRHGQRGDAAKSEHEREAESPDHHRRPRPRGGP